MSVAFAVCFVLIGLLCLVIAWNVARELGDIILVLISIGLGAVFLYAGYAQFTLPPIAF